MPQTLPHKTPKDIQTILKSDQELLSAWKKLTPLAQNEWICWTMSVKREDTRKKHVQILADSIGKGKKRPCCWPGCPHRKK